jgi:hypothetical protein
LEKKAKMRRQVICFTTLKVMFYAGFAHFPPSYQQSSGALRKS